MKRTARPTPSTAAVGGNTTQLIPIVRRKHSTVGNHPGPKQQMKDCGIGQVTGKLNGNLSIVLRRSAVPPREQIFVDPVKRKSRHCNDQVPVQIELPCIVIVVVHGGQRKKRRRKRKKKC